MTTTTESGLVSIERLAGIQERMLPMLRLAAAEYEVRTPPGFPVVVDAVDEGVLGIELDPNFSLYIVSDGSELFADMYYRSSRTDALSSASREKFSGMPANDRRPLPADPSFQDLRNLIAELMSRFNVQSGIIHITDS